MRTFSLRATKSQRLFEKLRTGWVIRYCMYSNKRRGFYLRAAFIELRFFFYFEFIRTAALIQVNTVYQLVYSLNSSNFPSLLCSHNVVAQRVFVTQSIAGNFDNALF